MIRLVIGSVAGAVAMFIAGFILWATPLSAIGWSSLDDAPSAAVQASLAQNMPGTGRYAVPNPATQQGTVLWGRGPVATIDYNAGGFSTSDPAAMIGVFVQELVVTFLIGLSLWLIAARVSDFASRVRLVVGFAAASAIMIRLQDPIMLHHDWQYALYALVADVAMLSAGGVVVAWFLPSTTLDAVRREEPPSADAL